MLNAFQEGVVVVVCVNIIAVLGMSVLTGFTRLFSFGNAGFMAIGAYTAAILIVRHNDMARRPVDENGRFKRGKHGLGATVERPGYPEPYARRLVKEAGERYQLPE